MKTAGDGMKAMDLWTYHPVEFDPRSSVIDYNHSPNKHLQKVMAACARVRKFVGKEYITWCYTKHGERSRQSRVEVEWHLVVPESEILALLDSLVWNRIIGIQPHLPAALMDKFSDEADNLFPNDPIASRSYCEERVQDFWAMESPSGDWWKDLVVTHCDGFSTQAVIEHPIRPEWYQLHTTIEPRT